MKNKKSLIPFIRFVTEIFVLIFTAAVAAFNDIKQNAESEGLAITENSIKRAVITCYAQEGSYPQSIDYLKENYRLHISDEYIVTYSIFASNIMPDIRIMRKQVNN